MKKLSEWLGNRVIISLIGMVVLSLLVWFVGPYIRFGVNNYAPLDGQVARLVTIIVIAVLWGLNNLRGQLRDKRNNEELVKDLQHGRARSDEGVISEQKSEEVHQIGERFEQALAVLKRHRFKGFGLKKGLYELPWYIIIGPPGAGKTTALVNSSLDFPLADQFGKGALRGVGGTRNCDWWFTNEAVLIDTAGRYTTQDSHKLVDSAAWEGFLDLLKKHRRRRPINGAIVAVSLQDLLTQSEEERILHARTIRSRIDELMDKLEIRFPIYMVFTKCDLISGFSEFFEDLGKDEREQVWGVTLPNAPGPLQNADLDFFSQEYRRLVSRLYERVAWRIHEERDISRRGAILGFPQQMDSLGATIQNFVQLAFNKNRYRFQPYLRGMYFTSGLQDGTPIDRLMSSMSSSFGFDRKLLQTGFRQGKSFFLGQLFKSVIFPESELVGANRRYEALIRWSQRAGYVTLALLVVVMLSVWAGSLQKNGQYLHEVESALVDLTVDAKRANFTSQDIRSVLPALNALARASAVYNQEAHPWLTSLGMYDSNVDVAADKAYTHQLKQQLLPKLVRYMESELRQGREGFDLYGAFRVYLMLNRVQYLDSNQIEDWYAASWAARLPGDANARSALRMHLHMLLAEPLEPSALNQDIIKSARAELLRVPMPLRLYSRIKADSKLSQRRDLLEDLGDAVSSTYVVNETVKLRMGVPLLFTKQGYDSVDLSPDSEMISSIAREKWVLADDDRENGDLATYDQGELSAKVKEYYLADYGAQWQHYYDDLVIKPFENIDNANNVLAALADPVYSPILSVLRLGAGNTQLSSQVLANIAEDNKRPADNTVKGKLVSALATEVELPPVDKQFRSLNLLLRETATKPAQINDVLLRVRQLQELVNEIAVSPEPGKKSFDIVKRRYQSGEGNAITALSAYAKNLPAPVNRWLSVVCSEAWKVVVKSAHGYLDAEWRSQVYEPYARGLAGKFPLSATSSDDIAINDFIEFFKPGGTVDKFSNEYVKPFLDARRGGENRLVDNYSIGISENAISQVRRANEIKAVFFTDNAALPSLTFQLKPYDMKKTDALFMLEMGGKRVSFSHGPKLWETINWSGDDSHTRVRIMFEDLNGQQNAVTYDGPWAWFRLQERSKLSQTKSASSYLVTYTLGDETKNDSHSIQYELKAKSVTNPFSKDLFASFRVPSGL